jgi:hypothetical protein
MTWGVPGMTQCEGSGELLVCKIGESAHEKGLSH